MMELTRMEFKEHSSSLVLIKDIFSKFGGNGYTTKFTMNYNCFAIFATFGNLLHLLCLQELQSDGSEPSKNEKKNL